MASFWRGVFRYERAKAAPWLALRNSLGLALPLVIGVAAGYPGSGLIGATGALNVSFSDGSDPYRHRLRRMLLASLFCSLAVIAGGLSAGHQALAAPLIGTCGFAAGMMVALGTEATDISNVTVVTLIVFLAQSLSPGKAVAAGAAALGGGLLQTLLSLAFWPFLRYGPERRILAQLYQQLAAIATTDPLVLEAPPASAEATQAQVALTALNSAHSIEAERYLALLSQAERIRLALLVLARMRIRLGRETCTEVETAALERSLEIAKHILLSVSDALASPDLAPAHLHPREFEELRSLAGTLRQRSCNAPLAEILQDARWQVDALAGQLRSAVEMSGHATPSGGAEFDRHEASRPWSLRAAGVMAVLRANLNLESAVFRHAVRLGVSLTVGELVAHQVGWRRPYWIPMTIAIVLRPDFTTTFVRGILRVVGTLIGLGLATGLFHLLAPQRGMEVVLIVLYAFLLRCFGPANYGIFAINLTGLVVVMFAVTGIEPGPVIVARGLNTLVGGVIALAAYQLWPTWERSQVPEALARMLEGYRSYFQSVRDAYLDPDDRRKAELDQTRQTARLSRSNAEASVARLAVEPGVSADRISALHRILANSHRLIHAVMSLEAGLVRTRAMPARDEFRTFANHVDVTLYYLAAVLRGSKIEPAELPDLREDYHALVGSKDPVEDRYALVNVEADRITNSLNTLALEVLAYLSDS
ncbi:MAG TPA: FUSC family protein [Bryobacteraceae bacterium]|nr:FUSC family protein [Bryobacteraceae bacterium]